MKMVIMGLAVFSFAINAWGEVFQMDRTGDTIVEVQKSDNEYRVTCKFRPQTKFDKAINAKFNDTKGDSLCKKGLARYLKVATNEILVVSGLYSAAPVETVDERLCYSFGVPVSGCKVEKCAVEPKKPEVAADAKPTNPLELKQPEVAADAKPKNPLELKMPNVAADAKSKNPLELTMPNVAADAKPKNPLELKLPNIAVDAKLKLPVEPKTTDVAPAATPEEPVEPKKPDGAADVKPEQPAEPEKPAAVEPETPNESANAVVQKSSFLCVVKYKEINGERKTISRREYRGRNFKSSKEFDRFCQEEFARIRAQGEANLRAVRNFGK